MSIFCKHLTEAQENYFQHCINALRISFRMFIAAVACFIHAFIPWAFIKTGTGQLFKILESLANRKGIAKERCLNKCLEILSNHSIQTQFTCVGKKIPPD